MFGSPGGLHYLGDDSLLLLSLVFSSFSFCFFGIVFLVVVHPQVKCRFSSSRTAPPPTLGQQRWQDRVLKKIRLTFEIIPSRVDAHAGIGRTKKDRAQMSPYAQWEPEELLEVPEVTLEEVTASRTRECTTCSVRCTLFSARCSVMVLKEGKT